MFVQNEFQNAKTLLEKIKSTENLDKRSLEFLSERILREHFHSPQYLDLSGTRYIFNVSFEDVLGAKGKLELLYADGREPIAKLGPKGLEEVNASYAPNLGCERARFLVTQMSHKYKAIEQQVLNEEL